MAFENARLIASTLSPDGYPRHSRAEVALAGRSNVGKSSLVNALVPMRRLAHVSKEPGRTRTINFYALDDRLCLVDLPGYGYARVSQALKESWGRAIEQYLRTRPELRAVIVLIDARHGPTRTDLELWNWMREAPPRAFAVATKWDKLKQGERARRLREMRAALGEEPIAFSAVTGEGRDELIRLLKAAAVP